MIEPLVSVRVITYNHEKFIAQCLEGILMQRTNFPFEIVVGEDCSTDRTREIVFDYQARYPDIIRVITSEKNVGAMANVIRVQQACRGKYHAFCEGDDYWIDPLKLQRQVDLLEKHQDISLCFHNVFILNEKKSFARLHFMTTPPDRLDFNQVCLLSVPLSSVMARSEILSTLPVWRKYIIYGDILLRLWCAHHGKLAYINEIMSVYCRHKGSITNVLKPKLARRHSERLNIFLRFDAETAYQHSAAIHNAIKVAKEMYHRERLGWIYYLLHPSSFVEAIKKYITLTLAEKKLW